MEKPDSDNEATIEKKMQNFLSDFLYFSKLSYYYFFYTEERTLYIFYGKLAFQQLK